VTVALDGTMEVSGWSTVERSGNKVDSIDSTNPSSIKYPSEKALVSGLSGKESTGNKVTALSASSTDKQYPTAKAVYTIASGKEDTSNKVTSVSASSTDAQYPTAKCLYGAIQSVQSGVPNIVADGDLDEDAKDTEIPSSKAVIEDLKDKEDVANKGSSTTGLSASSTDTEYPSAKTVYQALDNIKENFLSVTESPGGGGSGISSGSTDDDIPSSKAVYDYVNGIPDYASVSFYAADDQVLTVMPPNVKSFHVYQSYGSASGAVLKISTTAGSAVSVSTDGDSPTVATSYKGQAVVFTIAGVTGDVQATFGLQLTKG
jgi:3-methyladenine DNA glycosylase AlkC